MFIRIANQLIAGKLDQAMVYPERDKFVREWKVPNRAQHDRTLVLFIFACPWPLQPLTPATPEVLGPPTQRTTEH
eukprot:4611850-Alexandrium_andersonii.AAC.1